MAVQPQRTAPLRRIVPIVRRVNNWVGGLYQYTESGRVPEQGMQQSDNLMLSEDGSVIPRPFVQAVYLFGHPSPPPTYIRSEIISLIYNDERYYVYADSLFSGSVVTVKIQTSDSGGRIFSLSLEVHDFSGIARSKIDPTIRFAHHGDYIVVYSDTYDIFNVIDLSPLKESGTPTIHSFGPIEDRPNPTITIADTYESSKDEIRFPYVLSMCWRNHLNQSTPPSEYKLFHLSQPWDEIDGQTVATVVVDDVPVNAQVLDVYLGDTDQEPASSTLLASYQTGTLTAVSGGFQFSINGGGDTNPLYTVPGTDTNSTLANFPSVVKFIGGRLVMGVNGNRILFGIGDLDIPAREVISASSSEVDEAELPLETRIFDFSSTATSGGIKLGSDEEEIVAIESAAQTQDLSRLVVFTANPLIERSDFTAGQVYNVSSQLNYDRGFAQEIFIANPIAGQPGTIAPKSVVNYNGNIYYWSLDGIRVIGADPATELSQNIRRSIREAININRREPRRIPFGFYHDQKIIWSSPDVDDPRNSRCFVLDLQGSQPSWSLWDLDVRKVFDGFDPDDGTPKLLFTTPNASGHTVVSKFSDTYNADCIPFHTHFKSAQIRLETAQAISGYCLNVLLQLYRIRGDVDIYLYGQTETGRRVLLSHKELSVRGKSSPAGWGALMFSENAWGDLNDDIIQSRTIVSQERVSLEVYDSLQWLEVEIITAADSVGHSTVETFDDTDNGYSLGEIEIQYLPNFGDIGSGTLDQSIYR